MMHDFMDDAARARVCRVNSAAPLGETGGAGDRCLWLLSKEAYYVTGIALPVDGGFTAG